MYFNEACTKQIITLAIYVTRLIHAKSVRKAYSLDYVVQKLLLYHKRSYTKQYISALATVNPRKEYNHNKWETFLNGKLFEKRL